MRPKPNPTIPTRILRIPGPTTGQSGSRQNSEMQLMLEDASTNVICQCGGRDEFDRETVFRNKVRIRIGCFYEEDVSPIFVSARIDIIDAERRYRQCFDPRFFLEFAP